MTVEDVETTIDHALRVIHDWEQARECLEDISWFEVHTRYAIIDPIIRALGWKTEEPEECQPECLRTDNGGMVDYALFANLDMDYILKKGVPAPTIIIEAKRLNIVLTDADIEQLQRYVNGRPPMTKGIAVLTNGTIWRMYEIQGRRTLRKSHCTEVNIQEWDRRPAAEQLHELLRRPQVPQQVPT